MRLALFFSMIWLASSNVYSWAWQYGVANNSNKVLIKTLYFTILIFVQRDTSSLTRSIISSTLGVLQYFLTHISAAPYPSNRPPEGLLYSAQVSLPLRPSHPSLPPKETVTVSGPVPDLVDFALRHGTTYALLKEANLWLRDSKLTNKSGKTYRIVIP